MKKRILIADDEARVQLIMHDTLRKSGDEYDIVTVSDGHQALQAIQAQPFDLLIADVYMPIMNAIELTRALRTLQPEIQVIWMTAYSCQRIALESAALSIYRCLDKPIEIGDIRRIVRQALAEAIKRPQNVPLPGQEQVLYS